MLYQFAKTSDDDMPQSNSLCECFNGKNRVCFQRARAARAPPRSRYIWASVE